MGLFQKLFGKHESGGQSSSTDGPKLINQGDNDTLSIDIGSVSHAFVAMTHADLVHSETLSEKIAEFNRHCQPRVWNRQFRAKFVTFAVNAIDSGFPNPLSVGPALESAGLESPYSLVINMLTISLDGGRSENRILAGFAYEDNDPKIVLPRNDGCVAK